LPSWGAACTDWGGKAENDEPLSWLWDDVALHALAQHVASQDLLPEDTLLAASPPATLRFPS